MHRHRAIYFPGQEPNRLLTHFYSFLFFASAEEERRAKRYMRDRLRYHDQIFCTGSRIIEKLQKLQVLLTKALLQKDEEQEGGESINPEAGGDESDASLILKTARSASILQVVEQDNIYIEHNIAPEVAVKKYDEVAEKEKNKKYKQKQNNNNKQQKQSNNKQQKQSEKNTGGNGKNKEKKDSDHNAKKKSGKKEKVISGDGGGRRLTNADSSGDSSNSNINVNSNSIVRRPPLPTTPPLLPQYVAFHIRRGDFQQKHTRLPAEQIVSLTNHLIPDRQRLVAYISTDEGNRSFFEPFMRAYGAVYFLSDLQNGTDVGEINQNYVGMIEQVVCASADVFIGTPLSTFTAYITRMRGFMNRTIIHEEENPLGRGSNRGGGGVDNVQHIDADNTQNSHNQRQFAPTRKHSANRSPAAVVDRSGLYNRTYYFMNHHMHQLHTKPHVHFPLWIRDFVEAFQNIDDDYQ